MGMIIAFGGKSDGGVSAAAERAAERTGALRVRADPQRMGRWIADLRDDGPFAAMTLRRGRRVVFDGVSCAAEADSVRSLGGIVVYVTGRGAAAAPDTVPWADITLDNSGTIEQLYSDVDDIVARHVKE